MTLQMWTTAMVTAKDAWEDQSEALESPFRNLAQAESRLLGSRVGPAATTFLATWEKRVDKLRRTASGHADALAGAMYDLRTADAENVQAIQDLLVWSDHDTVPLPAGATLDAP